MPNIWIVIVVLVLLAFLSVRTFHITLKRRLGKIRVEVDVKLLGLVPRKTRVFNGVIGAYMKTVTNREGNKKHRVVLNAGTRHELLSGENVRERCAFEVTEQINDFIENSGVSEEVILIKEGEAERRFLLVVALIFFVINGLVERQIIIPSSKARTSSDESSLRHEVVPEKKKEITDVPELPYGAMKPEFCRITEITSHAERGSYELWGEMDVSNLHAGNLVNDFMRNTSWEPDGGIKQSNTAYLSYTNGEYHLSYLFMLRKITGKNACIISWETVD